MAVKRAPIGGEFLVCGSYYAPLTYADELWDGQYVEACKELDLEFPAARLLPAKSWSLGLSPAMITHCKQQAELELLSSRIIK
jgi:hypothetical protein